MPSFLQVENISKSYGHKTLFENISFNINEGDKISLVAPNGTGKTSLLRILAGIDGSDSGGSIKFLKDIRIAFLEQDPVFDESLTVDSILSTAGFPNATESQEQTLSFRRITTELGLSPEQKISQLSGGEKKRLAIALMLSKGADFLIMDEPTNHLDLDGIEYLENALKKSRCTLFMVTHDRYFLDRVSNTVMELDHGALYTYKGDYATFLEKRSERIANYNAETARVNNLLRRELEWMHATPCARSGKAKYRKQAFWDLKERAESNYISKQVTMEGLGGSSRLGNKVIDCKGLSFSYGAQAIVKDFSYSFQRGEKLGIVGGNGVGKSSFLNLLCESDLPQIERGSSINIGYYRQEGIEFKPDDTVLDIIPDTRLLEKFLFPHEMFSNRISKLSGGEKRRLYLLTILIKEPNLLILDEPTNDLDIVTLNVLEEYLLDFKGTLIIVTHDRHFLDRLADHLLVFCGEGLIKDFLGGYTEYRSFLEDLRAEKRRSERAAQPKCEPVKREDKPRRLSFKEKRELEQLETKLEQLNKEKNELEVLLSGGTADYKAIEQASARFETLKSELDEAEIRWLELDSLQ